MICYHCAWRWGFRVPLEFVGEWRGSQFYRCANGHEWIVDPPRW